MRDRPSHYTKDKCLYSEYFGEGEKYLSLEEKRRVHGHRAVQDGGLVDEKVVG